MAVPAQFFRTPSDVDAAPKPRTSERPQASETARGILGAAVAAEEHQTEDSAVRDVVVTAQAPQAPSIRCERLDTAGLATAAAVSALAAVPQGSGAAQLALTSAHTSLTTAYAVAGRAAPVARPPELDPGPQLRLTAAAKGLGDTIAPGGVPEQAPIALLQLHEPAVPCVQALVRAVPLNGPGPLIHEELRPCAGRHMQQHQLHSWQTQSHAARCAAPPTGPPHPSQVLAAAAPPIRPGTGPQGEYADRHPAFVGGGSSPPSEH